MTKSSNTPASTPPSGSRRRHERDAFSDKEAAKMLGIPVTKLYRICDFFDSDPDDAWDLIEGEFFEYEPGQARKRRFYEEGRDGDRHLPGGNRGRQLPGQAQGVLHPTPCPRHPGVGAAAHHSGLAGSFCSSDSRRSGVSAAALGGAGAGYQRQGHGRGGASPRPAKPG